MPNVAIVTDSVADLPPKVAEELGITVVPLVVRFGTDVYRDGLDLSPDQFYRKLKTSKVLPLTSVPPPMAFSEAYDKLAERTNEVVVISLTSKLSATYQVALQAVGLMKKQCRVEVLDSQWAVMAQGFVAIAAAKAARTGASIDEVLDVARETIHRVDMRAAFDTLEYLERGGRIGKAQAFLGSLLKINPVIGMKDGEVHPYAQERSRAKAIDYLYNFAASSGDIEGLAVEYATDLDEANSLVQRLHSHYPQVPIYLSRATAVIGTHTGPSLILVSACRREATNRKAEGRRPSSQVCLVNTNQTVKRRSILHATRRASQTLVAGGHQVPPDAGRSHQRQIVRLYHTAPALANNNLPGIARSIHTSGR